MSLPEEEAFALRSANDFLLRLGSGEYSVESITKLRQEARRIMCHFPLDVAGRWMSISTVVQQAKAEQREESRADMLDALIDRYFRGEKNGFDIPDAAIQWIRAQPEYQARYPAAIRAAGGSNE